MNRFLSWFCNYTVRPIIFGRLIKESGGWENIPPTNYILVSNHLSHLDELICGSVCTPRPFHFIGQVDKYSGFKAKLRDFIYYLTGTIPLDRNSKESGVQVLATSEKYLNRGDIILMYPEGTRSRSGKMGPAKKGCAVLAVNTGLPILPMCLSGTYELAPPGEKPVWKKTVKLMVGKPLYFHEEMKKIKTLEYGSQEYGEALQDIADKAMYEVRLLKAKMDNISPQEV